MCRCEGRRTRRVFLRLPFIYRFRLDPLGYVVPASSRALRPIRLISRATITGTFRFPDRQASTCFTGTSISFANSTASRCNHASFILNTLSVIVCPFRWQVHSADPSLAAVAESPPGVGRTGVEHAYACRHGSSVARTKRTDTVSFAVGPS